MKYLVLSSVLALAACGASTPVKKSGSPIPVEKQAEFRSVGAVISFNEICLKRLSTESGISQWESEKFEQLVSNSPYKKSPEDKVYIVGSSLAQFTLVTHNPIGCSIFADDIDGQHVHNNLLQVFQAKKKENPGSNIKLNNISKSPASTHQAVLVSVSGNPIMEVIISIKPNINGTQSVALTGAVSKAI
jgi:hypothetical protein